jgi:pimeloyl-ACP methyl ester carboxylesterase
VDGAPVSGGQIACPVLELGPDGPIRTARVAVPVGALQDLQERLTRSRIVADPRSNADWRWGTGSSFLAEVAERWAAFDWRAAEDRLNRFPAFVAELGPQRVPVYFVHERGSGPSPMPLILTHGWPMTHREFLDVIEPLAHPERFGGDERQAFDVIVPALPGYGLSGSPSEPIGPAAMADLWLELMQALGYGRFAAFGCDWGSMVASQLARRHPESLTGIHLSMPSLAPELKHESQAPILEEEIAYIQAVKKWRVREGAYAEIQATKPLTLSQGLNDSPTGLAAWILEKYHGWGDRASDDPARDVVEQYGWDALIETLSLYWFTGSIFTANALYRAAPLEREGKLGPGERVRVPTAFTDFLSPRVAVPPRCWIERAFDVRYWSEQPYGGHFAALAAPEAFVGEVRSAFEAIGAIPALGEDKVGKGEACR